VLLREPPLLLRFLNRDFRKTYKITKIFGSARKWSTAQSCQSCKSSENPGSESPRAAESSSGQLRSGL